MKSVYYNTTKIAGFYPVSATFGMIFAEREREREREREK
jgi:hypothetical protein